MAKFNYKAHDPQTNRYVSIIIEAGSEEEANRLVLERGVFPVGVKKVGEGSQLFRRVGRKQRLLFTSQLSTLIGAGLPLLQSLRNIAEQLPRGEMKKYILDFVSSVESGVSFSDALAKYPDVFDQIYVNLVRAGEISGTLDVSLDRLATQQEKDEEMLSKVRGAMVYPAVVVGVMILVVIFMLVFVLPKVEEFYADIEAELFWLTKLLLATSRSLRYFWFVYVGVVVGVVLGFLAFIKTPFGRSVVDTAKIRVPVVKKLFRSIYMARFCRTMATLFGAGINLIEALQITSQGINNMYVVQAINRSVAALQEGGSLSSSLKTEEVFDTLVGDMIAIGEESGKTEEMFTKAAIQYEKEVEKQIKTFTTLLEPFLIISLGSIALVIVMAILVPIYNIINETII